MKKYENEQRKYYEANRKNRDEYYRMLEKVCIPNFTKLTFEKYLPFTRVYLNQLLNGERPFKDEDLKRIIQAMMKYRAAALRGVKR